MYEKNNKNYSNSYSNIINSFGNRHYQSKVFNNSTVIKITEEYNGGTLTKLNKGVLVATYFCSNGAKKTIFKWENYTCPSSEAAEENNYNKQNEISWEEITEDGINEELLLQNIDVDI